VNIRRSIINRALPEVHRLAPDINSSFLHQTVRRAIHGTGPLRSAADAAEDQLREQDGDVDAAIRELIENNAALAAVEGFVTNLGGLVTLPATIPANITALALLQCRLVAGIAYLRGYDLSDDRVRNAIMLCTLGEDAVKGLVRSRKVPGSPMLIATAPAYDPELDKLVAGEVTSALVGRVLGKRAAIAVIRRTPVAGGVWGAGADAFFTWQVGRYAAREFLPRTLAAEGTGRVKRWGRR